MYLKAFVLKGLRDDGLGGLRSEVRVEFGRLNVKADTLVLEEECWSDRLDLHLGVLSIHDKLTDFQFGFT